MASPPGPEDFVMFAAGDSESGPQTGEAVDRQRDSLKREVCARRAAFCERKSWYDEQIARLQEQCAGERRAAEQEESELCSRINMLAPVCRLPREVLEKIFLAYVYLARGLFANRTSKDELRDSEECSSSAWERITRVCRHWRAVAHSFPALWTWIAPEFDHATTTAYIQRAIMRSGTHPLTVYNHHFETQPPTLYPNPVHVHAYGPYDSSLILFHQLPRMRVLQSFISREVHNFLKSEAMQDLDAPLLQELYLVLDNVDETPENVPRLPDMVLPSLRSFTLVFGTPEVLASFSRTTLTALTIRCPYPRISPVALTNMLRALPLLESLSLEHVEAEQGELVGVVSIPRLKQLTYIDYFYELPLHIPESIFLDRLYVSPTLEHATLHLSGPFAGSQSDSWQVPFNFALTKLHNLVKPLHHVQPAENLEIRTVWAPYELPHPLITGISVWRNPLGDSRTEIDPVLHFSMIAPLSDTPSLLKQLFAKLDVKSVGDLQVRCQIDRTILTTLSSAMPSLETLTAHACSRCLIELTSVLLRSSPESENGETHFPRLRDLHLQNLADYGVDMLIETLLARKKLVTELQSLKVSQSRLLADSIARLQSSEVASTIEIWVQPQT